MSIPSFEDWINMDEQVYLLDVLNRPWYVIGGQNRPGLIIDRMNHGLSPMDMPRHTIVPESPWARETWRVVDESDPRIQRELER